MFRAAPPGGCWKIANSLFILRRDTGALTLNQSHARDADPQFFGSQHAPLFGLYHDPAAGQKRRSGVVICPPLGEEIFPAHRMLRVLATQLARAGFPVLRFDYLGCGNSWADDLDVTVSTCLDSLSRAVGRVREQSGCERIVVIGLRFGGTIAGMSAAASPGLFHECVMWDPVLDGNAYLGELQRELRETVEQHVPVTSSCDTAVSRIEAIGQRVSVAFEAQLAAISADYFASLPADRTVLVDTSGSTLARAAALSANHPLRRCVQLDFPDAPWRPVRASGALVPATVLRKLTNRAEQQW
jgi:pimeloyl-ACP methyl ester carboxylesterase